MTLGMSIAKLVNLNSLQTTAVQFNSIVGGVARERCRMCDRNPTEFSSGQIFPLKLKDFFLKS